MNYTTLDYLPDLTYSQRTWAQGIPLLPTADGEYAGSVVGVDSGAIYHSTYQFSGIEGATYLVMSISYFDPYSLRIYDQFGNAVEESDENFDSLIEAFLPASTLLIDGAYYELDLIAEWVAPYSGTFYVDSRWQQGSYYTAYGLWITEDRSTAVQQLPVLSISASNAVLPEGDAGLTAFTFTVNRTGNTAVTSSVSLSVSGAAVAGSDFQGGVLPAGDLVFAPGETSRFVYVYVAGDTLSEANENFTLIMSNPQGALIGTASAQGTILNDDAAGLNRVGTTGGDILSGGSGADMLSGLAGNDVLAGLSGNDSLDGGAGIDVAQYSVSRSSAGIDLLASAWPYQTTVSAPGLGTDLLTGVERLAFTDRWYALDMLPSGNVDDPVTKGDGGNAGKAYRLYQAAFNRVPDPEGLGYWIAVVDGGNSLYDIATGFIESDEFQRAYGSGTSNAEFLSVIYQNVLGRDYDPAGFAWWRSVLDSGQTTRQQVLVDFSESAENKTLLAGVIGEGFEYIPYS